MDRNDLLLLPRPKEIDLIGGSLELPRDGFILLGGDEPGLLLRGAEKLRRALGHSWQITASPAAADRPKPITLACDPGAPRGPEGYALDVTPEGVTVRSASPAGVYYGVCTLCQLLSQSGGSLPLVSIADWPDFAARGVMLDISRDKVPTLDTLMDLVDMLSEWKLNQVQLYTEHTFAYLPHEVVWREASPMTGEDILKLDAFCRERFVELVPNQNSFGHMERWLKHEEYNDLAEAPNGFDFPWGHMDHPFSLNPLDPRSLELVAGLYDELLPHFRSRLFNVGLDETFDLGQGRSKEECERLGVGRVYLDFLLKIHELVQEHGRTMLFWGDIILHHPELIDELPRDSIALEWGYEADHPFAEHGEKFAGSGIEFWVCPGTSSWNTISGRTENCIDNLRSAAVNGLAAGATGYLNTDWGDSGHLQYLPVSYLGFMYGAAASWNAADSAPDALPDALSAYAFGDAAKVMGKLAYDLGNAYTRIARRTGNATMLFHQIHRPFSDTSVADSISAEEFDRAQAVAEEALRWLKEARMDRPDADVIVGEFTNTAATVALACRAGKARLDLAAGRDISEQKVAIRRELAHIIAEHERLWLARNRPGGLSDSRRHLDPLLTDGE